MRRLSWLGPMVVGLGLIDGRIGMSQTIGGLDLAELKTTLANASLAVDDRARRALEGASTIDQAAQEAASAKVRRELWAQATGLLDEFLAQNPKVESAPLLRFQSAVYRWAEGRSFAQQFELGPADVAARQRAIETLDDAVRRLRNLGIKPTEAVDTLAQNARFRLAQAIVDRSKLGAENDPGRTASEREALGLLDTSLTAPGLRGFARILRAELAVRLGLYGQAQMEIEEAEKLNPAPPVESLLETKVDAMIGRELLVDARKLVDGSKVDESLKRLLRLRLSLARRRVLSPGRDRREVDAEALRIASPMVGSSRTEARRGLMELARAIDEPPSDSDPEWWDLLGEGQLRLGDPVRAGRLIGKGADRATVLNRDELASTLRFKAGACLFEAARFAEADRVLTDLLGSTKAPRELRARAGMLRALARGRAVATRQPGSSKAAYQEALEAVVRDFPDEPSTGEARWLLSQIRIASGRRPDALNLLSGIKHGHPRWLEAKLLAADLSRESVEAQRISLDPPGSRDRMEEARKLLRPGLESGIEAEELVPIALRRAVLELTPEVGSPTDALEACDRVLHGAATADQHRLARLYRSVALALAGRMAEAEQAARAEVRTTDPAGLLPALRPLSRAASETDSEITRRRLGLLLRIYTSKMVDRLDQIPAADHDLVRLEHARALCFAGDLAGSKQEIIAWGGPKSSDDPELLRELGDLYLRLEAFGLAIEVERLRTTRLEPGSPAWFEAKYALALAYYRTEKAKEARHLIDATTILHPDLGGGGLRPKFEKLRQKLGDD